MISAIRLYLQTICVSGEKIGAGHKAERMVNQNCVVYLFQCDMCNAAGYTARHLHQCIVVYKH